jgi:hypothetical protein
MDPNRFDAITKTVSQTRSRRGMLKSLGAAALGAIGLTGVDRGVDAAPGGNSACAAFCAQVYGDTRAAGQCTSQAAHGHGLCYQCGPKGDGSQKVCGQTCIPVTNCCTESDCPGGTCQSGTCVPNGCTPSGQPCDLQNPGACCSHQCDNFHPPAAPVCF